MVWVRPSSRFQLASCFPQACRVYSPRSSWPSAGRSARRWRWCWLPVCGPRSRLNPMTSIETMTTYIVQIIGGDASYGEPKYLSLFAVGLTLFGVTLILNIISGLVLRHFREVYQ